MSSPRVVILGAGVTGASVAYHLSRRGIGNVVVRDRAATFGSGSTSKATGGFRAQFDHPTEVQLSLLSREKLRSFEAETGVDPGYRPYGYLFLATSEAELESLRKAQQVQHDCGLHEARMISADEARKLNPAIDDAAVIGGAFCPTDGFVRPMNILRGYAEAAQRLGVRFEFERDDANDADIVIDTRGAWCGPPVVPLRRNVAATIETDVLPDTMPMTIWSGDWFHLRIRDKRVLLLWSDDPPIDDDAWLAEVLRMTRERVPILRNVPIDFTWSGFYEMSPDGHALVGRVPGYDNRWIASGSCGHGVMHAPAIGEILAAMITGEESPIDNTDLNPDRFS